MRTRKYELGKGRVRTLESSDDLRRLAPASRKLVPERMVELWTGAPSSILKLAQRATVRPLAQWLTAAATAKLSLEVYEIAETMPPAAFLAFDFGSRATAGGELPWVVLIDCGAGMPRHCPPALAEAYQLIGGLVTQYGGSGTLISPSAVARLDRLGASVAHLVEVGGLRAVDAKSWYPYFECDGDYLCYSTDGRSRWFGCEWSGSRRPRSTRRCVEHLFRALRDGPDFGAPWYAALSTAGD